MLEPYEWKRSCTVLRGERERKLLDLLDYFKIYIADMIGLQGGEYYE